MIERCFLSHQLLTILIFWSFRVISKVVPAPEAKPATPASRPKTPPPVPSPVPAPVHVTPPPAPAPPPPQPTVSPVVLPPPSPAVSAAGGSKAPVRSVVTETVSTYVVGAAMCCPSTFIFSIAELRGDSSQTEGARLAMSLSTKLLLSASCFRALVLKG